MKTFTHLLCVLILSIVLFACNNAHFLMEIYLRSLVIPLCQCTSAKH